MTRECECQLVCDECGKTMVPCLSARLTRAIRERDEYRHHLIEIRGALLAGNEIAAYSRACSAIENGEAL